MQTLKQLQTPSITQKKLYPDSIEKIHPNYAFVAPAITQLEFIKANLTKEYAFSGFPLMYLDRVIRDLKDMLYKKNSNL
jgi:hypothetical protein